MKPVLNTLLLFVLISSVKGHEFPVKVPGGTIYQTVVKNVNYRFEHAKYTLFIPDNISVIKGIFIHQHGCTMEGVGASTAYDIQYQAFARKWNLAILGPDLYPQAESGCGDWINPEDGSGPALISALNTFAELAGHAELGTAPWLLWGHSGGGYWVLAMMNTFPHRILASVCYSPAFDPHFQYSKEAAKIPVLIRHSGPGDFNDPGVDCWGTALHTFSALRNMGGLIGIAYNAGQNHNFSFIRHMTFPFFESVLKQRLPDPDESCLKDMDHSKAWLCDTITNGVPQIHKALDFRGNPFEKSWIPDSVCAKKFQEFIVTGIVKDITAPPSPYGLTVGETGNAVIFSWDAEADIESGIQYFNIYRNYDLVARFPENGNYQQFNTNGDDVSPCPAAPMVYVLPKAELKNGDTIKVATVNNFNLESEKATIIWIE